MMQNSDNWNNLKQVIASSSGFDRWQRSQKDSHQTHENHRNSSYNDINLDDLVRRYLRETLETLAY